VTITDDIVKTFRDATPLYAVAGAADLAAEKLREVPPLIGRIREQAPVRIEKLRATDRKVVQERVTAQAKDAQTKLNETLGELDLKKLGESVQNAALQGVGRAAEAAVRVRETYDELAVRGKGAVATWRGQAADEVVEIAAAVEVTPEPEPEPKAATEAAGAPEPPARKPAARRGAAAKKTADKPER
jgi:heparin binding hemagglutinin HbhA